MADWPANSAGGGVDRSDGGRRLPVMLPLPLPEPLDYLMPDGAVLPEPGSFVRVELGPRRLVGVVWEGDGGEVAAERLKPVLEILPTPPLRPELRHFVERVAAYTMAPPGMVLRMAMSVEEALLPPMPRRVCAITPAGLKALDSVEAGAKLTAARRRVLDALRDGGACSAAELSRRAACTAGVVRGLVAAGFVAEQLVSAEPPREAMPDWDPAGPSLSSDQEIAARRILDQIEAGGFSVTMLDGVTGSGKTETYFAAIAAALKAGRQVLVLLPEIALGAQWLARFRRRFGANAAEWHSEVSQAVRRDTWRAVADATVEVYREAAA